jgi:hypothetical protein
VAAFINASNYDAREEKIEREAGDELGEVVPVDQQARTEELTHR